MMKKNKITMLLLASPLLLSGAQAFAADSEDGINVHGAVRVNYGYKFYSDSSEDKFGDMTFDMMSLKFDGKKGNWGLKSDYRFTSYGNYMKFGYAYYDYTPEVQVQFGINKVPFANPGYISNSYWFGLPYYLGFEDDHDMGVKATYKKDGWQTDFAFYKNAEYSASENATYSANLYTGTINGTEYNNEETNQLNLRQLYTFNGDGVTTTAGASVEVGQIYNSKTGNNGSRYAVAAHLDTSFDGWNIQAQALHYHYDAADAADDNKIAIAVVGWQYEAASKGQVYNLNIAKTIPTDFGNIKFYNDFGMMTPDVDDNTYENSYQNVIGAAITAGPTYTHIDFIMGKNMTFSTGSNDHIGLPEVGDDWDKRINISTAYYF
ncbi:hypothetical protein G3R49_00810 [Shewanella sp. WXL01]|uniref:hypothetical protein n=1 Tax=Shewanella sp. WXL01 TaxID=2709721 RepID=UPI0014383CA4|nr:hypothetical protein [Shewanella sp. WXL01]NKF49115.1 hypothetical protein [Shewanella sp. WXL01]